MRDAIVDSSVVIKWVVTEDDSAEALSLRGQYRFKAPDLLYAECANTLRKLTRGGFISKQASDVALKAIQADAIDSVSVRFLMGVALDLALDLDHPAYDCIFAALALREGCPMITADKSFVRKMQGRAPRVMTMSEALAEVGQA